MHVCHQHKLVYLRVPRTASTATAHALHDGCKAENVPPPSHLHKAGSHHWQVPEEYGHYQRWCVVRHPVDRWLSWCAMEQRQGKDPGEVFQYWKDNPTWAPQVNWTRQADMVFRFEDIKDNLAKGLSEVPCITSKIEPKNVHGNAKPEWTPTEEFLEFYREDFEDLGYLRP